MAVDKALGFANDLFNALESAGHRVVIGPADAQLRRERVYEKEEAPKQERQHDPYGYDRLWSPYRSTVVYVDSLSFGLAIVEMTEAVVMRYVNDGVMVGRPNATKVCSPRAQSRTWSSSTTTSSSITEPVRLPAAQPHRWARLMPTPHSSQSS